MWQSPLSKSALQGSFACTEFAWTLHDLQTKNSLEMDP
ncbi:hypothetical protein LEMLEM_LOCUS4671 [Lemmus lemmus]